MDGEKFLIIYFVNLLLGVLFGNLWYCFGINILFASLYVIYNHVPNTEQPMEEEKEKNIQDPKVEPIFESKPVDFILREKPKKEKKTEPSPDDNVYDGVEISKEEYEKKLNEQTGWYSKMTDQLDKEVDKLHNFFDKNGNKQ